MIEKTDFQGHQQHINQAKSVDSRRVLRSSKTRQNIYAASQCEGSETEENQDGIVSNVFNVMDNFSQESDEKLRLDEYYSVVSDVDRCPDATWLM